MSRLITVISRMSAINDQRRIVAELDALQAEVDALKHLQARPPPNWTPCSRHPRPRVDSLAARSVGLRLSLREIRLARSNALGSKENYEI